MENEFVAQAQNNESIQGQCWRPARCSCVNSRSSELFWVIGIPAAGSRRLLHRLLLPPGYGKHRRMERVWGAAPCTVPFSAGWDGWENKDALAEGSGEPLWLLETKNVLGGQPWTGSYFQSRWGLATSGFRVYRSPLLALTGTVSLVQIACSFPYLLPCTLQHLWGTDKSALGDVTCDSIYKHLTQSSFYLSPGTPPEELHQSLALMLFIPASVRVAFWFYFFVVVLGVFI